MQKKYNNILKVDFRYFIYYYFFNTIKFLDINLTVEKKRRKMEKKELRLDSKMFYHAA